MPPASTIRLQNKEAGEYLKRLRKKQGMTQSELSKILGFEFYTMVDQIESGKVRAPSNILAKWADALNESRAQLGKRFIEIYDPQLYELAFDESQST